MNNRYVCTSLRFFFIHFDINQITTPQARLGKGRKYFADLSQYNVRRWQNKESVPEWILKKTWTLYRWKDWWCILLVFPSQCHVRWKQWKECELEKVRYDIHTHADNIGFKNSLVNDPYVTTWLSISLRVNEVNERWKMQNQIKSKEHVILLIMQFS